MKINQSQKRFWKKSFAKWTTPLSGLLLISNLSFATTPKLAQTFTTDIYIYNAPSSIRSKLYQAEQKIKDVIRSEEFKNRVLNFTYGGKKRFVDNNGLTNSQIYYKILYGAERLSPTRDNEMDLKIKTYYQNSSTVGWTTPSSSYINMNRRFLYKYTSNEAAKTMVHEWLHKLGFSHSRYYSTSRNYSVPYGIGKIIMELATKY